MNKEEKIRNLKVLLQECLSNLGFSLGQERDPDELWVNNVESLTAGIRALQAQGAAEPERPKSREAEMLSDVLQLVADCVSDGRLENTTADGVVARMLPDLIHTVLHDKCIGTRLETAALKEAEFCARCIANRHVYDDVCVLLGNLALLLIGWIDPDRAMEGNTNDQN